MRPPRSKSQANKGYLYPISNDLSQIMGESEDLMDSRVITCEGHTDFVNSLQNFNKDVLESHILTFVYFWAEWCGPCKGMKRVWADFSTSEVGRSVKIVKILPASLLEDSVAVGAAALVTQDFFAKV